MSRKLLYTLVAVSIVASVLIAANKPAKKQPVYINAGAGEVTITLSTQYAVARFGWLACSKGLTQDFIDHAVVDLELYQNSILLQTVSTGQGSWNQSPSTPDPRCLHINEPQVGEWLFSNLNLRRPGTYTLLFHRAWTSPLGDGFDGDGDGFMDIYPPADLGTREVIINVLP